MNVGLQFTIADEYFRSGMHALQRPDLSERDREAAVRDLETAKETFEMCRDSGSPDLNFRLRIDIHNRIVKIRELLVGAELRGLVFEEE